MVSVWTNPRAFAPLAFDVPGMVSIRKACRPAASSVEAGRCAGFVGMRRVVHRLNPQEQDTVGKPSVSVARYTDAKAWQQAPAQC